MKCCICGKEIEKGGMNNPTPVRPLCQSNPYENGYSDNVCCNECNHDIVVPIRMMYYGVGGPYIMSSDNNAEELSAIKKILSIPNMADRQKAFYDYFDAALTKRHEKDKKDTI